MIIKYKTAKTSLSDIIGSTLCTIITFIFFSIAIIYNVTDMVTLVFVGACCLATLAWFFYSANSLFRTYLFLHSSFNLKSVNFLPNRIEFKFFQPQYNFICDYSQIEGIELLINTDMIKTKNGTVGPVVTYITVVFSVFNDKKLEITTFNALSALKPIYDVIDLGRTVNNFSYRYTGYGALENVTEKIETYAQTGEKLNIATKEINAYKACSLIFYGLGCWLSFMLKETFDPSEELWVIIIPIIITGLFFITSFFCDVQLLIHKFNARRYC